MTSNKAYSPSRIILCINDDEIFDSSRREDAGLARGANSRMTNNDGSKKIKSDARKIIRDGLYVGI